MVGNRADDGALKALTPPDYKFPKNAYTAPTVNLTLQWAHGFRSWDVKGNLKYEKTGKVVHGNDIVAMAMHPELDIVATGQMANEELDEVKSVGATKKIEEGGFKGKS